MKTDIDVVVVGAGFAGLALAGQLARQGMEVRVIERRPELPREGAAVTLQPNGIAALERLGILEEALWAGTRFNRVSVRDSRDRELARWDYAELPHRHAHLLGIERFALLSILAARLDERSLLFGHRLVDLLPDGVRHERGELRARCVVGADGAGSAVRERLGIHAPSGRPDPYVVGFGARHPAMIDGQALLYCGAGFANGLFPHQQHAYFWDHPTGESLRAVEERDFEAWRARYWQGLRALNHGASHIGPVRRALMRGQAGLLTG